MPERSPSHAPGPPPSSSAPSSASRRSWRGFGWGVVATLVMSAVMIAGMTTGVAPMPEPIPAAIIHALLGSSLPAPLLSALAIGSHLAYGGFWGAVLVLLRPRVTIWEGLALGAALWLLMQVVALPALGWGFFGTTVTPAIAVATLVLHLVYGTVLGWSLGRKNT